MAVSSNVKWFPKLSVNAADRGSLVQLIHEIRPQWQDMDIYTQEISGGFINKSVCCYHKNDTSKSDWIVVRVWENQYDGLLPMLDRDKEVAAMQIADAVGCGPDLYAIFLNGVAMKFIVGRTLAEDDLHDPVVARSLARALARLHLADTDKIPVYNRAGHRHVFDKKPRLIEKTALILGHIHRLFEHPQQGERFKAEYPSAKELEEELQLASDIVSQCQTPTCLCHIDPNVRNCIYSQETGEIYLIDFEMSMFFFETIDIASYLVSAKAFRWVETGQFDDSFQEDSVRIFIKYYLEEKKAIKEKDSDKKCSAVAQAEIEKIFQLTMEQYAMMWLVYTLVVPQGLLAGMDFFDYLRLSVISFNQYKKFKDKLK